MLQKMFPEPKIPRAQLDSGAAKGLSGSRFSARGMKLYTLMARREQD